MPSRNFSMVYESNYDLKLQIRSLTATIAKRDAEIERLQSHVQELEAEQRWIPVSERLPNVNNGLLADGTIDVLIKFKYSAYPIMKANYYPKMNVWNMPLVFGDESDNITHWANLPKLPKEK